MYNRIFANQTNLSRREREISDYVLNNADFVVKHTIIELAKKVGVSESSINRFCKKIGYKGFNDFKLDLVRGTTVDDLTSKTVESRDMTLADRMSLSFQNVTVNTLSNVSQSQVDKSAQAIADAGRVMILGNNITRPSVIELGQTLTIMGINNNYYTDPNDIRLFVETLPSDTVVIMIAQNLFSTDFYETLMTLTDNDVRVIGITYYDSPRLNELLFAKFIAWNGSYLKNSEALSNNFSFILLCGLLTAKLTELSPAYERNLIKAKSSITRDTFLHDPYI